MFRSSGNNVDGRAMVEVEYCEFRNGVLALAGTASAFEGNLLVFVQYGGVRTDAHLHTQASAGGPERGDWSIEVPIETLPVTVVVGDEDARFGGISPRSAVALHLDRAGQVRGS